MRLVSVTRSRSPKNAGSFCTCMILEPPVSRSGLVSDLRTALDRRTVSSGAVAALFATTGPLALLLTVARESNLSQDETVGWICAGYGVGGLLSVLASALYRQPIGLAWSIPGTAMLLVALDHLSFGEAVGAYLVCGLLMVFLGLSGWIGRMAALVPLPVVMGMVAGVFLPFGVTLVTGFLDDPLIACATVGGFLVVAATPTVSRRIPAIVAALLAGAAVLALTGRLDDIVTADSWIAVPTLRPPVFTVAGLAELVPPLLISVIAIQNLQGFAILSRAGHSPPVNVLTTACGYGSLAMGAFGSVPTCVTGPVNGILTTTRPADRRWAGGIVFGVLIGLFGLFAPLTTSVAVGLPPVFIGALGGLAMMPVLANAFTGAFSGSAVLGPVTAFIVTVSDVSIFNIGAPFWGLVFGVVVWLLLDRERGRSAED